MDTNSPVYSPINEGRTFRTFNYVSLFPIKLLVQKELKDQKLDTQLSKLCASIFGKLITEFGARAASFQVWAVEDVQKTNLTNLVDFGVIFEDMLEDIGWFPANLPVNLAVNLWAMKTEEPIKNEK